ncbi:MAG: glutathione S-transferase family protein [Pseudomonadota bacterium]
MIKLYGFPVSNYYNMVKFALLEKGLDFEEVMTMPGEDGLATKSPMGKVPAIETDDGVMCESTAIFEYLEAKHPSPSLMPSDPFAAGKVREMIKMMELYVELNTRRHYGQIFFGGPKNDAAVEEVKPVLEKGLTSIAQLGSFSPYVMGNDFTYADIFAAQSFMYPNMCTGAIYEWDIIAEVPGLQATLDKINERPAAQKVGGDQQAALAEMQAQNS